LRTSAPLFTQLCRVLLRRSSQYSTSRHSGEAFSTVGHPPKLGHIGQPVNARGFAYATCCALQPHVARQFRGRGFGIESTADNAPDANIGDFLFLRVLQVKKRADERTRTADLISLGVCGLWLLSVARAFKTRIDRGFSVLSIAHVCRVLRPG
jgi:hypothetical protein